MNQTSHSNERIPDSQLVKSLLSVTKLTRIYVGLAVRDADLVVGQDDLINILSEQHPQSVSVIAKRLAVQSPTASKMLGVLARKGFVKRVKFRNEHRTSGVVLSPEGARAQRVLWEIRKRLEEDFAGDLPVSEMHAIKASFDLVDGHFKRKTRVLRDRQSQSTA
ncbi:MarR family transcriptional regulator [Aurantimonas sp. A2-1-M11]|uniref:MarR family winged helix-turn-helix transcriptional regulator n=1 Tax=Aurantimonas sp. A2-1-M11 TaxID=3113712 RepID=UPI002F946E4F